MMSTNYVTPRCGVDELMSLHIIHVTTKSGYDDNKVDICLAVFKLPNVIIRTEKNKVKLAKFIQTTKFPNRDSNPGRVGESHVS